MNFAVLQVRDFSLHALRRSDARLAARPVAIVQGEGRHAVVAEVSSEASGVEPGMATTIAMARCPGIQLQPRDPAAEVEAQRLLLAAALTLSPRVEATARGCCTVDLKGADRKKTGERMSQCVVELGQNGLPVRIGTGTTILIADYAARLADPVLQVTEEAGFLRPLPLAFAEPTPKQAEILAGWGVCTLGALTDLPKAEIGERLGTEGVNLWERAAGQKERVLKLVEPPKSYIAEWRYEPPVESLEPLFFKLKRYAERVAWELKASGMVAAELTLTLFLEDETEHSRTFRLPEPSAEVDRWLRVLHTHLETVRTEASVAGVVLAASPTRPLEKQDGLFETGLKDPAMFWENLARLNALVGNDRVGTPVMTDTHRPDRFTLEKPSEAVPTAAPAAVHPPRGLMLRRFRPAWAAQVFWVEDQPQKIECDYFVDDVRAAAGPWHLSGDWWRDAWTLEIWQVELARGGVYQLVRSKQGCSLEGVFD
jgi:protein ImuB